MSRHTPTDTLRWRRLREIVRREEPQCWLCGMAWDPEARAPYEPAAFSVDHVLPAATHPEHKYDRDNLRAAHYGCNRARANGPAALTRYLTRWYTACGVTTTPGARITAGQTPVTSRDW